MTIDAEALRRVFAEAAGLDPRVMTAGHDAGLRAVYVEARKAAAREYLDAHGPGIEELTARLKAAEALAEAYASGLPKCATCGAVATKHGGTPRCDAHHPGGWPDYPHAPALRRALAEAYPLTREAKP